MSNSIHDGVVVSTPPDVTAQAAIDAVPSASQLAAYANEKQKRLRNGGISINIAPSGSLQTIEAGTDAEGLILLQGAYSLLQNAPSATVSWVGSNGAAVTLTAAQIDTLFTAVVTFIQATFAALASVIAAIKAGTITTTAQVDTPPGGVTAWPSNS